MTELTGSTAIVTGGAVRLGKAIAVALAQTGVQICLHYHRSAREADETQKEIVAAGGEAVTVQADFQNPVRAAQDVVRSAVDAFGRIDFLINSAAVFEEADWCSTNETMWDRHFDINLKTPFFLSQAFAHSVPATGRGHIVNILDWRVTRPQTGHVPYTTAKGALATLTRTLALELAPRIQVNAVAPGAILPPSGRDAAYLKRLAEKIPLQRPGNPDELVKAVLFLLRSDFVTGEIVHVSGGEELGRPND